MLQSLNGPHWRAKSAGFQAAWSMARAVVSDGLRSGPYQGFAERRSWACVWWPPAAWAVRQGLTLGKITLALGTLAQPPRLAAAPPMRVRAKIRAETLLDETLFGETLRDKKMRSRATVE